MLGVNKVILLGEVSEKPELRYTPEGSAATCFTLSVSRVWCPSSGKVQEETDWFNVVVWRELAERCEEELGKGTYVYVEGRLRNHFWRDVFGRQMMRTEVIAERIMVLESTRPVGAERHHDYEYQWRE